jgi:hypothetical protein
MQGSGGLRPQNLKHLKEINRNFYAKIQGWLLAMTKSIFAETVEKLVKTGKNWKTRSMLLVLGRKLFLAVQKAKFVKPQPAAIK